MHGLPGCYLRVSVGLVVLWAGCGFAQTREDGESPKQKERTRQQLQALAAIRKYPGGVGLEGDKPGAPVVSLTLFCSNPEDEREFRALLPLLAVFPDLHTLEMGGSCVVDEDIRSLSTLHNLREILICNAEITDAGVKHLVKLPKLRELHLRRCSQLTDKVLGHIQQCEQLEGLDLEKAQITDSNLARLRSLARLRRLRLVATQITDKGALELSTLPKLEALDLTRTAITDDALHHLIKLPKLRRLIVESTLLTDRALTAFQRARPDVKLIRDP